MERAVKGVPGETQWNGFGGVEEEPHRERAFRSVRAPAQAQRRGLRGEEEGRFVNEALPFTAKRVKGHALTMRRKRSKSACDDVENGVMNSGNNRL